MASQALDTLDITGKTFTADALATRRTLADYLRACDAHHLFIVTDKRPPPTARYNCSSC